MREWRSAVNLGRCGLHHTVGAEGFDVQGPRVRTAAALILAVAAAFVAPAAMAAPSMTSPSPMPAVLEGAIDQPGSGFDWTQWKREQAPGAAGAASATWGAEHPVDAGDPGVPMDAPFDPDDLSDLEAAKARALAELAAWWTPASITVQAPPPPPEAADQDTYRADLLDAGVSVSETGWVHPLAEGRFTSSFGFRRAIGGLTKAGLHNGIDIAAPLGYPIRAAAAGTVVYVGYGSAQYGLSGWVIAIDHGDGVVTSYNHMSQAGVLVAPGDQVREGRIIALVGSEGRSTGPHLHFGVYLNGTAVDPVPYLLSQGIDLRSGRSVTPVPLSDDWLAAQKAYRERVALLGPGAGSAPGAGDPTVPTPEPTPTPTPTPTPEPTPTPTPDPTPSPSPDPTPTPEPTPTPTPDPTETPTPDPTPDPSQDPTPTPSEPPTPTGQETASPPAGPSPSPDPTATGEESATG